MPMVTFRLLKSSFYPLFVAYDLTYLLLNNYQAYVANLVVELEKGPSQFLLVLVAQPQDLDNLIKGKNFLQKVVSRDRYIFILFYFSSTSFRCLQSLPMHNEYPIWPNFTEAQVIVRFCVHIMNLH